MLLHLQYTMEDYWSNSEQKEYYYIINMEVLDIEIEYKTQVIGSNMIEYFSTQWFTFSLCFRNFLYIFREYYDLLWDACIFGLNTKWNT